MNPATFKNISSHLEAGRLEQARLPLLQVLRTTPRDPDANNLMAVTLIRMGDPKAALPFAERALHLAPHATELRANLANLMIALDRPSDAAEQFRRVLAEAPSPAAAAGLAASLAHLRRFVEAASIAIDGLAQFPGYFPLLLQAAGALLNCGRATEAARLLENAWADLPGDPVLARRRAATMLYAPGFSPAQVAQAHFEAGRLVTESVADVPRRQFTRSSSPGRRLRIGVLSSDLRAHPVAHFAMPLFEHLDRDQFELTCYHDAGVSDDTTARIRSLADRWVDSATLSDDSLAARIDADQIDILLELVGFTSRPRLRTLALKPAPVVMSWLGYPSTLGIRSIDARIVDSLTDPPGSAEALHVESLVRLDPCFLCYTPRNPPVAKAARDHIVFGSFNTLQKVNDPLLALWARVLNAVPRSRLLIKSGGLEDPLLQQQLRGRAARAGIDPSRLELIGHLAGTVSHLGAYAQVDIALDTFPYCGTTTTCEALSMGVPVVSLVGGSHVSRVGLTLLTAVGHPDWCVDHEDDYVRAATRMAENSEQLNALRTALPVALAASPLCDHQPFVDRFSTAIRDLWTARAATRDGEP